MFPILETEITLQIGDKTRLDASKSFGAEFTKIEIKPEGSDFIDCTDNQFLDWAFETEGEKEIFLRVHVGSEYKEASKKLLVVSSAADALYSSDSDLLSLEPEIYRYLKEGKSSFINRHRDAKKVILQELRNNKIITATQEDLLGVAINLGALKDWSTYLTLALIFGGENTGYGVGGESYFQNKAREYRSRAEASASSVVLGKDTNADNVPDEAVNVYSCSMVRTC